MSGNENQSGKMKVGIAGYGVVGKRRRHHIDEHKDLQTVAICDRTFDNDGAMDDGVRFYKCYTALLNEDLDILFVCLSNDYAAEVTIAALEHGLHVFCEKPPGRGLRDIDKVAACKKNHPRLKLMYGFNHRYHESVQDALKVVRSGELGKIINLRGVYGKSQMTTFNKLDWRTKRELAGGGILLDQGIHIVDLLRFFADDFADIYSFISNSFWNYDVEDNAYALMRTAEGVVAMLHSSATQWRHLFNLEITLEKGSIRLTGILSGSMSYGPETMTVVWRDLDKDFGNPKEQTTKYNNDPSWSEEINAFSEAILNDDPIVSGSLDDAMKTMKLVYQIYCADKDWRDKFNLSDK